MLLFIKLVLGLFIIFSFYLGIPAIIKIILRRQFLYKIKLEDSLYLTFDDGPNPEATPLLLDILRNHEVKATFFVTGEMAQRFPDIVSRIRNEGHELGGHGYSHCHPWKTGPVMSLIDMIKGTRIIKSFVGNQRPILFRPPYGKFNFVTLCYLIMTKQKIVFWDNDPKDYLAERSEDVVNKILQNINEQNVVLMHDGGAVDSWLIRKNVTVISVQLLLKKISRQYHFKTIGEVFDK